MKMPTLTTAPVASALRDFARWGFSRLGLETVAQGETLLVRWPDDEASMFGSAETVFSFSGDEHSESESGEVEPFHLHTRGFSWLVDALYRCGALGEAEPKDQPDGVAALTQRLFPAYQVEGGHVRLAGCSLEDRLILCLDYASDGPGGPAARSIAIDTDGRPLSAASRELLGLTCLKDHHGVRRLRRRHLARLVYLVFGGQDIHRSQRAGLASSNGEAGEVPLCGPNTDGGSDSSAADWSDPGVLVGVRAVWCKFAEGKLRFRIHGATVELPFAGWARDLKPPAFVCPESGMATYHLAATDDDRIVAVDALGSCAVSGRRVLRSELVRCQATERDVLRELTVACPVSGHRVLRSTLVRCAACGQLVSPLSLADDLCLACRESEEVELADWRVAALLDRYPGLRRWNRWRVSEASDVRISVGEGWLRRVLIVSDKQSHDIVRIARTTSLSGQWEALDPTDWPELLEAPAD